MDQSRPYRLVELANGARSLHSLAHGETFHPVIGPAAEAEALYVRQLNLLERLEKTAGEFVVWDVGLGAAANVLTLLKATRHIPAHIQVVSFDQTLEPLNFAIGESEALGYFTGYEEHVRRLLNKPNERLQFEDHAQRVAWELHLGDFPALLRSSVLDLLPKPHVILFDAFSPASNPEMWTQPVFARLYQLLDPKRPCALPTYSRSTMLRVTLLVAGFYVGRGHATGEKEETTIAANCLNLIETPLDARWLSRVWNSTSAEPLWEPIYRQAPVSSATWQALRQHPQFAGASHVSG